MATTRLPAVAGMFYPEDPEILRNTVQSMLDQAIDSGDVPKALIVPHAGYMYSGPVAASAYVLLRQRTEIRRVVLLGPSHRIPLIGIAASSASAFATPLGNVTIDQELVRTLINHGMVTCLDQAHQLEHSLEVHLPFLQMALPQAFDLLPLVVGDSTADEVSGLLDFVWNGQETLIVISSDLSHYHDYDTARNKDRATSRAIENLRYQDIGYDDACGRNPISGLLRLAKKKALHCKMLDLRNSGDTAGTRDQVVGYGAYVIQ